MILGLALVGSCQKRQDDPRKKVSPSAARAEVLAAVSQCMLSTYQAGHAAVLSLRDAAQAAKADPTAEKRAAAETAWSSAMEIWQQAEVMQIGPAASVALPGGKNLRDEIYSWPLTGRCLVEQQLVSKSYEASTFSTALVNLRGLDAAEYLLFYKADDNACAANATINSGGTWAALGAAEITARKAAYAAVVADDIVVSATKLLDAWEPAKGNFVAQLETAGRGSATWSTDLLGGERGERRALLHREAGEGHEARAAPRPARMRQRHLPRSPGVALRAPLEATHPEQLGGLQQALWRLRCGG